MPLLLLSRGSVLAAAIVVTLVGTWLIGVVV